MAGGTILREIFLCETESELCCPFVDHSERWRAFALAEIGTVSYALDEYPPSYLLSKTMVDLRCVTQQRCRGVILCMVLLYGDEV